MSRGVMNSNWFRFLVSPVRKNSANRIFFFFFFLVKMTIKLWTRKASVADRWAGVEVTRCKPEAPGGAADTENRLLGFRTSVHQPGGWRLISMYSHWLCIDKGWTDQDASLSPWPPRLLPPSSADGGSAAAGWCWSATSAGPADPLGRKQKNVDALKPKKRKHFLPFSQFHLHSRGENIKSSFQQMTVGTTVGVFLCKLQI